LQIVRAFYAELRFYTVGYLNACSRTRSKNIQGSQNVARSSRDLEKGHSHWQPVTSTLSQRGDLLTAAREALSDN